ncbi:hypothetical protein P6P90_16295 [Ectobacillus antri]|jgi:hypothetical protein|uniref:Uncharacterized protein n=1 Tax=Ectobacillus antri TaxID=2486280 RepID=A0ABT6H812_9BACI|nr:hypothetical protein [Ectobacillus antri]MDG4658460.1 hypothetical protein [Ectobacillus antri]MDG5755461.1 hypothetical protein [Ectobacillus antri]
MTSIEGKSNETGWSSQLSHFIINPVIVGNGTRLFQNGIDTKALQLMQISLA